MSEHDCKHDTDLEYIKRDISETKEMCIKIFAVLNGEEGLVTKTAVHKSSIKRLNIWLGILSIGLLGWALKGFM